MSAAKMRPVPWRTHWRPAALRAPRRALRHGGGRELPPETRAALRDGRLDAVMFFSPRTAGLFLELGKACPSRPDRALHQSKHGPGAAPGVFADIRVAAKPNQAAMLDLVGPA